MGPGTNVLPSHGISRCPLGWGRRAERPRRRLHPGKRRRLELIAALHANRVQTGYALEIAARIDGRRPRRKTGRAVDEGDAATWSIRISRRGCLLQVHAGPGIADAGALEVRDCRADALDSVVGGVVVRRAHQIVA